MHLSDPAAETVYVFELVECFFEPGVDSSADDCWPRVGFVAGGMDVGDPVADAAQAVVADFGGTDFGLLAAGRVAVGPVDDFDDVCAQGLGVGVMW